MWKCTYKLVPRSSSHFPPWQGDPLRSSPLHPLPLRAHNLTIKAKKLSISKTKKLAKKLRSCWLPKVRVSDDELEKIKSRADKTGLSLSEYQRRMCLSGRVTVKNNAVDLATIVELKSIGNNLNQLTKSVHIRGLAVQDQARIQDRLEQLYTVLETLNNDR